MFNSPRLDLAAYRNGILGGDRFILAQAITLVESVLPADQDLAGDVINAVLPYAGNSLRIGITGAPGVGKSTFIEAFGKMFIDSGKKVAVLTVDPSSQLTGGSILGDKTRMQELARDPRAFIRPSPSGRTLGGVASQTREAMLLCEATGFEIIIVETVGTGQSEIAIKNMVDFFLLLMQPGSGDELQGIKKGIVEMADAVAITKADGDSLKTAKATQADFQHALHLLKPQRMGWTTKVVTCSALTGAGMQEIHDLINNFNKQLSASGDIEANRKRQQTSWFQEHFHLLLSLDPKQFPDLAEEEKNLLIRIQSGSISPRRAAREMLLAYHRVISRTYPEDGGIKT
ncbi:MAG: methylmalonyl Co-A mutase-associated GTPase MeaB [Bacteroidota bacterium]|nr:methylmalonyl Co-A mutase-associated GTPase MeaB [Bacteroidota bacterium]